MNAKCFIAVAAIVAAAPHHASAQSLSGNMLNRVNHL
jgi:hypothetical protein